MDDISNGMKTIIISRMIKVPRERIWKALVTPDQIRQYNQTSEGWTMPLVEVDAQIGGKLRIGFGSPDDKNNFEFEATFTEVVVPELYSYAIADGRSVSYTIEDVGGQTKLTIVFALESQTSEAQQRDGWVAIMNNLAIYVENNP